MNSPFCAIGECMIELSGNESIGWQLGFAGDTFNTTWYVRALLPKSHRVAYFTAFGDDPFSTGQREFFEIHGIESAESPTIPGTQPGLYAITLDPQGERTFTYWRNDSAARWLANDRTLLRSAIDTNQFIYLSGITLAILGKSAREALLDEVERAGFRGSTIVFDPNYRPSLWKSKDIARAAITEACRLSNIVLTTHDDEAVLFNHRNPAQTVDRLAAIGVREFVVKCGADPAIIGTANEQQSVPAVANVEVRDTTAAGDSFNGAYVAARIVGRSQEEAARTGHRVAAQVVSRFGALIPMSALAQEILY